jgi:hypothetical protein
MAVDEPEKYISIIIDGMDQSKTYLPKHAFNLTVDQGAAKLKVHVMGVLVHGHGAYAFNTLEDWPSDANLNIECLSRVLGDIGWDTLADKTLFLQLDNTTRENKNHALFGWLAALVKLRIIKEVCMPSCLALPCVGPALSCLALFTRRALC